MSANTQFAEKMKKTALGAAMVAAARAGGQAVTAIGNKTQGLPDVSRIGVDGVDHINIGNPSAATELGTWLAHNAETPFEHPLMGRFESVESFWHWLKSDSRRDVYRTLHGNRLRSAIKADASMKQDLDKRGMVSNFRVIILLANVIKLQKYTMLAEELKNSTLPLDMYYVVGETERNRPVFSPWLVEGFEEIRSAMKEEREPNFTRFLDKGTTMENVYAEEIARIEAIKNAIAASKKPELDEVAGELGQSIEQAAEQEVKIDDQFISGVVDQAAEQAAQ